MAVSDVQIVLAFEEAQAEGRLRGLQVTTDEYQGRFEIRENGVLIAVETDVEALARTVVLMRARRSGSTLLD